MRLGEFELVSISDGTFRLDGGQMFGVVPKTMWEPKAPADERNRVGLSIRPLLVRTGAHNVLIDAGIGGKWSAKEIDQFAIDGDRLDRSLAQAGLTAREIDVVIATHLHFDHAGGFTTVVDGVLTPRFPRAKYFIRRGEWEAGAHPNERTRASYLAENFLPLQAAGVVEFIDEDEEIVPGIRVARTGGHTRDHQIVFVTSGGRTAVFAADLIPTTAHVREAWIMGFDLYPMDTFEYKKRFVPEAVRGEYVIFFEHDPAIVCGILRRDGTRVRVEGIY